MDIGLVSINLEEGVVEYAGANSPGYLVRDGEVTELRPDKRAIASFEPGTHRYETHRMELQRWRHDLLRFGRVCRSIWRTKGAQIHAQTFQGNAR